MLPPRGGAVVIAEASSKEEALALVMARSQVMDCFQAASVCRFWRSASERPETWQGVIFQASLHTCSEDEKQVTNNILQMRQASLEVLLLKLRRVCERHNLAVIPPPAKACEAKSPMQLRRSPLGKELYWWLCYNTTEFGWFDKNHTTTFATGLKIWAPCPLLCRWFSQDSGPAGDGGMSDVVGRAVLELGAGIGMLGVTIAARAKRVVITDINAGVLRVAALNAYVNKAQNVEMARLAFGRESAPAFRAVHGLFDVIVGADIIYAISNVRPMFESVDELLSKSGLFCLGFIDRNENFAIEISTMAEKHGFELARPCRYLAEALGDRVPPKAEGNAAKGMLAELKRVLEQIPKGGACLGESAEKVQLFEFRRRMGSGSSRNEIDYHIVMDFEALD